MENKLLDGNEYRELVKTVKKYANLFKVLYQLDPAIASDFKRKQESYFNEKSHSHHDHNHDQQNQSYSSCCTSIDNEIYIPKDKMNNIEKVLNEVYSEFYYEGNLSETIEVLSEKYNKIVSSGIKQGMVLDAKSDRDLIHRMLLEGVPFMIFTRLKSKLKQYEESISEQPMLLAHPSGVENKDFINILPSQIVKDLIIKHYTLITQKLYDDIQEYELYNEIKYIYAEGNFEDKSTSSQKRSDFTFQCHMGYFKGSKHKQIYKLLQLVYYLPFELNAKYSDFNLQVNDYASFSYFQKDRSCIDFSRDSSFAVDTGKKITVMLFLFPPELEFKYRNIKVNLQVISEESTGDVIQDQISLEITTNLPMIILKSRLVALEIPKHEFNFVVLFYYIHGPADKEKKSC